MTTDPAAVEVFLKSWRLYQEIIGKNYMFHREISDSVRSALAAYRPDEKLRILDLGCGDGSMTLPLIPANRIAAYTGCDLSKPALDIAQKQIHALGVPAKLFCDDMLNIARDESEKSIDLVYSSYAIHHLNANQKQEMVEEIARILKPGGMLILIDIFREPSEDRAAYIKNYMGHLRTTWCDLSTESQDLVIDHATNYDFPETPQFYTALCHKHGLGTGRHIAKHTWHEAWIFEKV